MTNFDEIKDSLKNQKKSFLAEPNISWQKRKENLKKLGISYPGA